MPDPYNATLHLEIEPKDTGLFELLFQHGVGVKCRTGITVEQLLIDDLGIEKNYLEEKLNTVFLDGSPVDDIGTALIRNGTVLALSSSMPGLAGATLRRKGIFSEMRRSITYDGQSLEAPPVKKGSITIKLFNVLARDLGPVLMTHGILIEALLLAEFIRSDPRTASLMSALKSGAAGDPEDLIRTLEEHGTRTVEIMIR